MTVIHYRRKFKIYLSLCTVREGGRWVGEHLDPAPVQADHCVRAGTLRVVPNVAALPGNFGWQLWPAMFLASNFGRQLWPATLAGNVGRQHWPAMLAGLSCRPMLPAKVARQSCQPKLPAKVAGPCCWPKLPAQVAELPAKVDFPGDEKRYNWSNLCYKATFFLYKHIFLAMKRQNRFRNLFFRFLDNMIFPGMKLYNWSNFVL